MDREVTMLECIRKELPESRSEMVNELDLQEEVTISPYTWTPSEDPSSLSENTWASYSLSLDRFSGLDLFSESSLPVSHAMTEYEIDCGKYRRFKNRSYSDPWNAMKDASVQFPPRYLDSLHSFYSSPSPDLTDGTNSSKRWRSLEDLRLKMERYFDEECRVFSSDESSLTTSEEGLHCLDTQVDTKAESSACG